MKVYRLKGIECYVVAFNKVDAVIWFSTAGISVTENDIMETVFIANRDELGKVFKNFSQFILSVNN